MVRVWGHTQAWTSVLRNWKSLIKKWKNSWTLIRFINNFKSKVTCLQTDGRTDGQTNKQTNVLYIGAQSMFSVVANTNQPASVFWKWLSLRDELNFRPFLALFRSGIGPITLNMNVIVSSLVELQKWNFWQTFVMSALFACVLRKCHISLLRLIIYSCVFFSFYTSVEV